jgi:uncharacterized protein (TIGR03435 family)
MMVMRGCNPPDLAMYRCTNMTLKALMIQAYGVKNFQIEGPAWLDSEGYDIEAKLPEGASKEQIPAMLQALLAERFKVTLHKENKPLPVYELAVAKGGPKLKEVDPAELEKEKNSNAGSGPGGLPPAPPPPPPPGAGGGRGGMVSMMMVGGAGGGSGARMTMGGDGSTTVSGKMTITQLANLISRAVDRPVVDTTGLKGTYDIELTYLAENSPMVTQMRAAAATAGVSGGAERPADASAPIATVFQAVKGLGLTMEGKKSPFEVLVIDNANKVPTEN